jgi:hypothetical protein
VARANTQFMRMISSISRYENAPDIKNFNSVYDAVQEYIKEKK